LTGESYGIFPRRESRRQALAGRFQYAETFGDLTVLENVATGGFKHRITNWLQDLIGTPAKARAEREVRDKAERLLVAFGLSHLGPASCPSESCADPDASSPTRLAGSEAKTPGAYCPYRA
jgi:ABC-type branched-subunit amino acid transport system ATPase component